ncbi:hypothetical protein DRQ07_07925 [candidate division KSB1 bacterium]|nr:MAG: hypothetical protein DRQ07_07925 [candidate division KSB1 bacterium]
MHNEQVITQLKEMHLSVMAESFQNRLDTGDSQDIIPEQFFSLLVEDEYMACKNRKLRRLITAADFKPEQACIENLEFGSARGL